MRKKAWRLHRTIHSVTQFISSCLHRMLLSFDSRLQANTLGLYRKVKDMRHYS